MIDFSKLKISKADTILISKIAKRAIELGVDRAHSDLVMDFETIHGQSKPGFASCPLDLQGLLDAADSEFLHDVNGIGKYLDRETGHLTDCWLPRFHDDLDAN